ncbi:MAG TPA: hypothetical protein VFC19_44450 [Candidatus Limnocylindrales bacterium]|nr:hypothetical protein [Candidatus Limnocylindrales bacterium]
MPPNAFDLDIEVIPARAPSPEEIAAKPQAAFELEEKSHCTPFTRNTWTFGAGKCPVCC